jgi:hypothetical protein
MSAEIENEVLALRKRFLTWGARKLKARLETEEPQRSLAGVKHSRPDTRRVQQLRAALPPGESSLNFRRQASIDASSLWSPGASPS